MGLLLPNDPSPQQYEVMKYWADDETEEILAGGSKGGGKSDLGINCIFHDALVYPETMYFIAREELNDLRKYTIPSIHEVFARWNKELKEQGKKGLDIDKYAPYNGQDNFFKCYNKSRIYLLEAKFIPRDPLFERFGSMQMTRGWIEEGGEVSLPAKTNLALSLGRVKNDEYGIKGKLLITCNPKKNWMKEQFIDPWIKEKLDPSKKVVLFNIYDNKHRQKGYEHRLENLTGVERQRLLSGNWNYDDDDDCLILGVKIDDLYRNEHIQGTGEKYISADIARFGKDKTVIFVWDGLVIIEVHVLIKSSIPETVNAITLLMNKHMIPVSNVIVDDDGVGGGVSDYLSCTGFVNNSSPIPINRVDYEGHLKPDNYDNLKSQCYYFLADKVNKAEVAIRCDLESVYYDNEKNVKQLLNQELENVRMKEVDDDRKKAVMPKDKIKELIGCSPDYSDAMMMRMYFELMPKFQILVG